RLQFLVRDRESAFTNRYQLGLKLGFSRDRQLGPALKGLGWHEGRAEGEQDLARGRAVQRNVEPDPVGPADHEPAIDLHYLTHGLGLGTSDNSQIDRLSGQFTEFAEERLRYGHEVGVGSALPGIPHEKLARRDPAFVIAAD